MIGIVDYGMGNLHSVYNSLSYLGFESRLFSAPEETRSFDRVILPGVGAYASAMENLQTAGFVEALRDYAASGRPLLGICLGMHLLSSLGTEPEPTEGLDIIKGKVDIMPASPDVQLPHVGWNSLDPTRTHPLFKGARPGVDYYFVHSYCYTTERQEDALTTTTYGETVFTSSVARDNIVGFQFHPEKSQAAGLRLLENFCMWDGSC